MDITDNVALDIEPLTIERSTDNAVGRLSCTVEGVGEALLRVGKKVTLIMAPGTADEYALFYGTILMRRKRRRGASGLFIHIDCASVEAWLDWELLVKYRNTKNRNGSVETITADDAVVNQILTKSGLGRVLTGRNISQTTNSLPRTNLEAVTVRQALDRIAERTVQFFSAELNRFYFIDERGKFYWYRGSLGTNAPYIIGDGSYVETVMGRSGLVALWTLREGTGTTVYDSVAGLTGTLTGGYTQNVAGGVVNEPGHRAVDLNGSTGYVETQASSSLHVGDTFTVECWLRRDGLGSNMSVLSEGSNGLDVGFDASDRLVIRKEGSSTVWTTDDSLTDDDWHHVAWTKDGSTRAIYVDGVEWSGSGTNATIVAASGALNIGRRKSSTDRYFDGRVQMVALYDQAKGAAVISGNYDQGRTVIPEDWEEEDDGSDVVHRVYVRGGDGKGGSGWVTLGEKWDLGQVETVIEDTDSVSKDLREKIGFGFLRWHQLATGGEFKVTDVNGWRLGQTLTFSDSEMNDAENTYQISRITTDVGLGSGVLTHTIRYGSSAPSQYRSLGELRNRRGR